MNLFPYPPWDTTLKANIEIYLLSLALEIDIWIQVSGGYQWHVGIMLYGKMSCWLKKRLLLGSCRANISVHLVWCEARM